MGKAAGGESWNELEVSFIVKRLALSPLLIAHCYPLIAT